MEVPSARLNPGLHFTVVDVPETPVSRWNKCSGLTEPTRFILPVIAFTVTGTMAFFIFAGAFSVVTNQESNKLHLIRLIKPLAWVAAGNLLTAALIERVSSCFGNKMKGLTTDTLMGTCFPILTLAGSFHLLKIIGPRGEMPIFNPV